MNRLKKILAIIFAVLCFASCESSNCRKDGNMHNSQVKLCLELLGGKELTIDDSNSEYLYHVFSAHKKDYVDGVFKTAWCYAFLIGDEKWYYSHGGFSCSDLDVCFFISEQEELTIDSMIDSICKSNGVERAWTGSEK